MTTTTASSHDSLRPSMMLRISSYSIMFVAIFCFAFVLRAIGLGAFPLSYSEAPQAMAAWHVVAPSQAVGAGSIDSVAVFAGAVIGFSLLPHSNAAARLLPMLSGMALVIAPWLFRHRLGKAGALLCMLLLALSPSAVAASRQMTGVQVSMVGVVGMLYAIDRYLSLNKPAYVLLAGIAAAIALTGDTGALVSIAAIAGGCAFMALTDEEGRFADNALRNELRRWPWRPFVVALLVTFVIVTTLFFTSPAGLGAAFEQIATFFERIVARPAGTPYLGLVLLAYEPMSLIFGLVGAWLASQSPLPWQRFLAGWATAALGLSLIYPGALPFHSLWAVVPLIVLSTLVVLEISSPKADVPAWGIIVHGVASVALVGMIVASLARQLRAPQTALLGIASIGDQFNLVLMIMWLFLLVIVWLTTASVWGQKAAWHGIGLAGALIWGLMALGMSGNIAFVSQQSPFNLFNRSPVDAGMASLLATAEDMSVVATTDPHQAAIVIQGDPNDALSWALHDFKEVKFVEHVSSDIHSVMVITPMTNQPSLGSDYVGQRFALRQDWSVDKLDFAQFLSWSLYRTADPGTVGHDRVILWVRKDVFDLAPAQGVGK